MLNLIHFGTGFLEKKLDWKEKVIKPQRVKGDISLIRLSPFITQEG